MGVSTIIAEKIDLADGAPIAAWTNCMLVNRFNAAFSCALQGRRCEQIQRVKANVGSTVPDGRTPPRKGHHLIQGRTGHTCRKNRRLSID
jgi:hypothetical protein